MKKYVALYRVSTSRQERSGLGIDAQKKTVSDYIKAHGGTIIGEFEECVSGRKKLDKRPDLRAAIKLCKRRKATLLVARTDRLSRNVAFLANLLETNIEFICADNPSATNFTLHIMAAVAEAEAIAISSRVKAALKAAKRRGVVLGKHGKVLAATNKANANSFAKDISKSLISAVTECWDSGKKPSYSKIAEIFNKKKLKTFHNGKWHHKTVKNYCERLDIDIHAVA